MSQPSLARLPEADDAPRQAVAELDRLEKQVETLHKECDPITDQVRRELLALMEAIGMVRSEVATLRPNALSRFELPAAAMRLDAVVQQTEEAATKIMDSAEELMALAGELEEPMASKVNDVAIAMFESATFQDITGQHVTRVMSLMRIVEEKLGQLARIVGDNSETHETTDGSVATGPAIQGSGIDQSAVDQLLAF